MNTPLENNSSVSDPKERKLLLVIEFAKFVVGFAAIISIALIGLRAVIAAS